MADESTSAKRREPDEESAIPTHARYIWLRLTFVVLSLASVGTAAAADAALERAAATMGVARLTSIRYSGDGVGYTFGQAYRPGQPWPKVTVRSFTRTINYQTASMRDEIIFARAEGLGGGGYPHVAPQRNDQYVSGAFAWNQTSVGPVAGSRFVDDRVHQLWLTPHGILKAALRNSATVGRETRGGRSYATVAFTEPGRFTAVAFIDSNGLVTRVESRLPDPVLGDTPVITTYDDYRDYGGIKFPARVAQSEGGFPVLDLAVHDVVPNAPADIALPDAVRTATDRVTVEPVANGVWFLAGGSHNSVVIEMKDHVIVVETPLNDERSEAVLAKAKELVPGKPVRFVINSHAHFDHSGGLRAAAAEGATIITQAQNKPYLEHAFAVANTIKPDRLARSGRKPRFVVVGDKMVLRDSARSVELYHVHDSHHSDALLMVYLPRERLLVEADSFTPGPPNAPAAAPAQLNPLNVNLVENLARMKISVDRVVPLHGRVVPVADLYAAVGQAAPR